MSIQPAVLVSNSLTLTPFPTHNNNPAPVETLTCSPNSVFAHSSTYAGCCSVGGNCNFPTACARGTVTNRLGGTWTCEPKRDCYAMTVYAVAYDPAVPVPTGEAWVVRGCAQGWSASTVWRALPATMVTAGSSSTLAPSSPAASTGNATEDGETGHSHAWVAGVAVGCFVAGALLGGGLWFLIARGRRLRQWEEEGGQKGFTLHSAWLTRSGRDGGRPTVVAVADGVEVEGGEREKDWMSSPQEVGGMLSLELEDTQFQKGR